jgi:UDP-N-acetylmuramate: L-alanyl-gamma-D-glutamyl-meso-diaminopimelate ligase
MSSCHRTLSLKVCGRKIAETFDTTDEIVDYISRNATPGDQIVVMSNGGFDGIHRKLLEKLRGR